MRNVYELPGNLPVPVDDGAAAHLTGAVVPPLELPSTSGSLERLSELSIPPTVFFFYPRTGVPTQTPNKGFDGEEWDSIPGARGCTPQACGFRDASADFQALGVRVFGVSTNTPEHQLEFKRRTTTPIEFLSDSELLLVRALRLPTFEFPVESGGPNTLYRRMAWYCLQGTIQRVWYPVFPPNENARIVLEWLVRNKSGSQHDRPPN